MKKSTRSIAISLIAGFIFCVIGFVIIYPSFGLTSAIITAAGLFFTSTTCFFPLFSGKNEADNLIIMDDEKFFCGYDAANYSINYMPNIPMFSDEEKSAKTVKEVKSIKTGTASMSSGPMYQGSYDS